MIDKKFYENKTVGELKELLAISKMRVEAIEQLLAGKKET